MLAAEPAAMLSILPAHRAFRWCPIKRSLGTVAGMVGSAIASHLPTAFQSHMNSHAPVSQFCTPNRGDAALEMRIEGDARRLTAGIEFDLRNLYGAVSPVFQDDGERAVSKHRRLPFM